MERDDVEENHERSDEERAARVRRIVAEDARSTLSR